MVEEVKYTVSASKTGSGTITGVPEDAVVEGTAITVNVTAAEGWQVKSVKVNGADATLTNGALSITVNSNTTIAVEFEEIGNDGNDGNENGDNDEKSGCGSSVAFASATMAIIALGGASFMLKKKNR